MFAIKWCHRKKNKVSGTMLLGLIENVHEYVLNSSK